MGRRGLPCMVKGRPTCVSAPAAGWVTCSHIPRCLNTGSPTRSDESYNGPDGIWFAWAIWKRSRLEYWSMNGSSTSSNSSDAVGRARAVGVEKRGSSSTSGCPIIRATLAIFPSPAMKCT